MVEARKINYANSLIIHYVNVVKKTWKINVMQHNYTEKVLFISICTKLIKREFVNKLY